MNVISKGYDNETLRRVQNIQTQILKEFIDICKENNLQYFLSFGSALGAVRHQGTIPWDDDIDVGMLREDYEKLIKLYKTKGFENLELLTASLNKDYATGVTHLQRKNTTFISEYSKDIKCHLGINIDIFPFDKVSMDQKKRNRQFKKTFIYRKLLFLRGTKNPNIYFSGLKANLAHMGCIIIHYGLILCGLTAPKIYDKFEKYCTLSNNEETDLFCSYGDYINDKGVMRYDDIFPLADAMYEGMIVKIPNNYKKHLTIYYGSDYMELPPIEKRVNHYPYKIDFNE